MFEVGEFGPLVAGNSSLPILLLQLLNITQFRNGTQESSDLVERNGGLENIERQMKQLISLENVKDVSKKNDLLTNSILNLEVMLANTIEMHRDLHERYAELESNLAQLSKENNGLEINLTEKSLQIQRQTLSDIQNLWTFVSENITMLLEKCASDKENISDKCELEKKSITKKCDTDKKSVTVKCDSDKKIITRKCDLDNKSIFEKCDSDKNKIYEQFESDKKSLSQKCDSDKKIISVKYDSDIKKKTKELSYYKSLVDVVNVTDFSKIKELLDMSTVERAEKLMRAAANGDLATVRLLLLLKTNVKYRDSQGNNALILATYNDHQDIGMLLIDAWSDIENFDRNNVTALSHSSNHGLYNLTLYLLNMGAQVNRRGLYERTALHWAAAKDRLQIVELLLERGADANMRDGDGRTTLEVAKVYGAQNVVEWLSKHNG